jgi:hypothetical protein
MRMSLLSKLALALCIGVNFIWSPVHAAPKRIALLVGVGNYADSGVKDLEGPPHDVAALKSTLTGKWGFPANAIRTLVDGEATRQGILAELDALKTRSQPGDLVFLYMSGHGTSDRDRKAGLPLPHTSGAFLPVDFPDTGTQVQQLNNVIIGQRDMRPRLEALEKSGRQLMVVFDSCFSGNAVRSIGGLPSRHVGLSSRGVAERDEIEQSDDKGNRPLPPPFPYKQVFFLAAASDNEMAADISQNKLRFFPTLDGKPHGAFTDALLRALDQPAAADIDQNGNLSNAELFESVARFMNQRSYGHQPQMLPPAREDSLRLAQRPVFALAKLAQAVTSEVPVPADITVRVQLEGDDGDMRHRLASLPGILLVEAGGEFVLRRVAGRKPTPSWRLLTPNGDIVTDGDNLAVNDIADIPERLKAEVWWRKLQTTVLPKRRFAPILEANPASRGGTFVEGETLVFDLRTNQAGQLLLLNLDAKGKVTVLYPFRESELKPIEAGKLLVIPGEGPRDRIRVTPPSGTDQLLALVFPQEAPVLAPLRAKSEISVDAPELTRLAVFLDSGTAYGAATYTLRVITQEEATRRQAAKP